MGGFFLWHTLPRWNQTAAPNASRFIQGQRRTSYLDYTHKHAYDIVR
jgi:hypothetical protein